VQGFWAIALILIGNFESLLSYFSFSAWIFYVLCAGILIHLRIAQPNAHRPYKMPLFPFIPIVFLLAAIYLILSQIASAPIQSGLSFLSILSGGVFYLFAAKRK
jgi:APA family basic amino acid/polyamine antiporter